MAEPLLETRKGMTTHHAFKEFDEIDVGDCEGMTYSEMERTRPELFAARSRNKYNFVYPGGEGYATMAGRVYRGVKKAIYLSGNSEYIMIIRPSGVNRMILSDFSSAGPRTCPKSSFPRQILPYRLHPDQKTLRAAQVLGCAGGFARSRASGIAPARGVPRPRHRRPMEMMPEKRNVNGLGGD
jgi:broad specificity phosphatase PhoE